MEKVNNKIIDLIVNELKSGNIVILPTDTVYGIACDALNEKAIKKVFEIKGRDYNKPLNIHLNKIEDIDKYALIINDIEQSIISNFMPGALTLVLKKKSNVSNLLTANLNTVGIRIPNDKIIYEIIEKLQSPLVLTSANISGEKGITNISNLNEKIINKVNYILDIGELVDGIESTVLIVINNKIKILREGKISKKEIEDKLNTTIE